jgi:hypothetical protein
MIEHEYDIEYLFDGGNVKAFDGNSWTLLYPTDGKDYDTTLATGWGNAIEGEDAFSGSSGMVTSYFTLPSGTTQVRLEFGSDSLFANYGGWTVYSVQIGSIYTPPPGVILVDEDFEGTFPPASWTVVENGDAGGIWLRNDVWGTTNYMGTGYCADADSDNFGSGGKLMDTELWTPSMDLSTFTSATLQFMTAYNYGGYSPGGEYADTDISIDGGSSWTNLLHWEEDHSAYGPGELVTVDLTPYCGNSDVIVRFHYNDNTGWQWQWEIDDVEIGELGGVPMFTPEADVTDDGTSVNLFGAAYTEVPLSEEDLELDLPAGWEMLGIDGPGYIPATQIGTVVAAVSIPPGTPIGDYDIGVSIPFLEPPSKWHWVGNAWWCGDDGLGTYEDYYFEELLFTGIEVTPTTDFLFLDHYIMAESNYDGGRVEVSTDGGNTWTVIDPVAGYTWGYIDALGGRGFGSSIGETRTDYFDLSTYMGQTIDIRCLFASDFIISWYDGWYIYSIELGHLDIIPGAGTLYMDCDFTSAAGWYRTIVPWASWYLYNSNTAGGEIPEAGLSWIYAYSGAGLYYDPDFPNGGGIDTTVDNHGDLFIEWAQFYDHYWLSSTPCTIEVQAKSAYGYGWSTVWSMTLSADLGPGVFTADISSMIGQYTSIQFVFYGSWLDMDWWAVDDILIYSGDRNDLYPTYVWSMAEELEPDMGEITTTISVVGKMKGNDLAYYRHTQNAMRELVTLDLNLENGMPDDGSLGAALDAYRDCDTQAAYDIASAANEGGDSYGYWSHSGGYGYFFNPGKNGNGMAGLTGQGAVD